MTNLICPSCKDFFYKNMALGLGHIQFCPDCVLTLMIATRIIAGMAETRRKNREMEKAVKEAEEKGILNVPKAKN